MATAAEVSQYRSTIDQLTLAATGEGQALVRELANPNPVAFRDSLIAALPALIQPYMTASAEVSAVWYEDLRRNAVGGTYAAKAVDSFDPGLVSGIARYAVQPLFFDSTGSVLTLLGAGLQKAIAGAGRTTISTNVSADRTKVRFARAPKAGCCAWCAMLAARGAVYGSERAAGGVVGRGIERGLRTDARGRTALRGGGIKTVGSQSLGDRYHGFCRCVPTAIWEGQDLPYDIDKYVAMYDAASRPGVGWDLAHIREDFDVK